MQNFLDQCDINDLPGVGRVTGRALADLNIKTVGELRQLPRDVLTAMFGQHGQVLYDRCRGCDDRVFDPDQLPQSVSRETTFHRDTADPVEIEAMLSYLIERAMRVLRRCGLQTRTVRVHLRYTDWKTEAAARTLGEPTDTDRVVFELARDILERLYQRRVSLRHIGIALSKLSLRGQVQQSLFEQREKEKGESLLQTMDNIRNKFGHAAIVAGRSVDLLGRLQQDDNGFVLRTLSLTK